MLQEGILFRSKKFVPDHRYTLNFVDMWSVDEVIIVDISRDISFEDKKKKFFFNNCLKFLRMLMYQLQLEEA